MRVLVTGGTRGIGAGIASTFVRAGHDVVICGRTLEAGKAAEVAIAGVGTGTCTFIQCDVSISADNERLVTMTRDALGGIDCLVNNAGWHPPHRPIDAIPVHEFVDLLRINLVSYFEIAKLALPALRSARGSIVNIGSLVGWIGQEQASDYVATKSAIEGLSKAWAIDEARHGVRVNTVVPGVIDTPSHQSYLAAQADPIVAAAEIDRWQWLGRIGQPDDVGQVCLFLASSNAGFVTGATLCVSGGAELGYGAKAGWVVPG